jgi:predicted PurR-regulated permease PerM
MIELPQPAVPPLPRSAIDSPSQRPAGGAQAAPDEAQLRASADRARARWHQLKLRLQAVTPSGIARSLLVLGAASTVVWLISSAWVTLLPFQVGLALAYLTLPLVNWLDRMVPRALAVALVILLEVAAVIGFFGLLVPPLIAQIGAFTTSVSGNLDIQRIADQLRTWVSTLPPQTQEVVLQSVSQAVAFLRENAQLLARQILTLLVLGSFTLLQGLGFLLGFLAIPAFLFAAMLDQQAGVRAINRALPSSVRADCWALARIVDRTFGSYLRGQLGRAAVFGTAVGAGLHALDSLNTNEGTGYPLVFATIAAVTYLIPNIGFLIGAMPAVAFALVQSREAAASVLAMYVGAAILETHLLGRNIERRSIDLHPFVLMPALVVASQFNLLLVILAAPLLVVTRDLFRYVYRRLGDPPWPAGVLPERAGAVSKGRRPPALVASRSRSRSSNTPYPRPLQGRWPAEEVTTHG